MDPKPFYRISWSQCVTIAEIEQDGGGLADHNISVLQERRGKWRMRDAFSFQNRHQSAHASVLSGRAAGDVDVVCACFFQRQPDEFATSLNAGPVIEFIGHAQTPSAAAINKLPSRRLIGPMWRHTAATRRFSFSQITVRRRLSGSEQHVSAFRR